MAHLAADLRDSTLRSLKLACPSAEIIDYDIVSPSTIHSVHEKYSLYSQPHAEPYTFNDADGESSDIDEQEQLIPPHKRRKYYKPRHVAATAATTATGDTSSDESDYTRPSHSLISKGTGAFISITCPSSPETANRSEPDELLQRFYHVTQERDLLWKALQKRQSVPYSTPEKPPPIVYNPEEQTLIEEVHALRSGVQIWTEEYFGGMTSNRTKTPHLHRAKKLFGSLTEDPKAYLENRDDRPLLIQAYIWSKLQQKIFSNWQPGCGYVWAGKLGDKQLRPINDTLRNAVKDKSQAETYHHWRATTVNLLVPQVDGKWRPTFDAAPVLNRISRLCSHLRHRLRPWSTSSLRMGKEQLRTIVSASVALDLKMKRQRADYRFVTFTAEKNQYWGYDFFDSEMEDIYEGDEDGGHQMGFRQAVSVNDARQVQVALAPALERCGDARGRYFDQTLVLVKADVSCKKLRKSKSLLRKRSGNEVGLGIKGLDGAWSRVYRR